MIKIDIDDKFVRAALKSVPSLAAEEMSKELRVYVVNTGSDFQRKKMRAPDDRDPSDILMHRPRTSKGLRMATGSLARTFYQTVRPTNDLSKLRAQIGFLNGKQARIARVHELGTVRYGGSLPDIVPVRAPMLRIPIRGRVFVKPRKLKNGKIIPGGWTISASRSSQVTDEVFMMKVGIPPRLGFISTWASKEKVAELTKRMVRAAKRALQRAVGRG